MKTISLGMSRSDTDTPFVAISVPVAELRGFSWPLSGRGPERAMVTMRVPLVTVFLEDANVGI